MLRAATNITRLFAAGGRNKEPRATCTKALESKGKVFAPSVPALQSKAHLRNTQPQRACTLQTPKKGNWVRRATTDGAGKPQEDPVMEMPLLQGYKLTELLGQGTYGKVFKAENTATGEVVAVKEVDDNQVSRQEASIMEMLKDCPSVVGLKAAETYAAEEEGKTMGKLYMVMELCQGGDLGTFVEEHGVMSAGQAAAVARELLQVVQACQDCRVLHGDIKPCNLAIGSAESRELLHKNHDDLERGWLKLLDFGASQEVGMGFITEPHGSPSFWAPEVFSRRYKLEADVWSVGVLIFHLQTSGYPFWSAEEMASYSSSMDLAKAINSRQPDFTGLPVEDGRDLEVELLSGMLAKTASERITAAEALNHPWLLSSG